jgi:nucleoside-diphosphate-sugar epimerase
LVEVLTRPSATLVDFIRTVSSPLLILGAGGKMGPTLAVLAHRAAEAAGHRLQVIAASRFRDHPTRTWLEGHGVKTVRCDLLRSDAWRALPQAENILYLVGLKFGTAQNPAATWAINTLVPARIAERFPKARVVALSTGNVYPTSPVERSGAQETDPLVPLGEYANAAVARERIFEFYSREQGTPLALLRLFYAVELRYGVLVDIARQVWNGDDVSLANGYFNCVWQGDANEAIIRSLSLVSSPPSVWNLCRPEVFSVRQVAARFGELLERPARFTGTEASNALLGNTQRLCHELGPPHTPLETMMSWIADWVKRGGRDLGKPTHFEVRDGNY